LGEESNTFVEEGHVYIRTHRWSAGDVLKGLLTNEAYEDTFGEWLQERYESQISLANDILDQYDLHDRFAVLAESHARGYVTPFIGAGMSIASGYPGWTEFLKNLRKQTTVSEAELDRYLGAGDYEGAADLLARNLGAAFNEAVESSFGCTRPLDGVIQFVPYVFSGPIITTNFDSVLKRSLEQANRSFEATISATQTDEVPRVLASGQTVQIRLHGTSRTGQGRVLTSTEYVAHYGEGQSLKKVIRAICARTLLFLGCSLCVDRTLSVIRDYVAEEGHDNVARHYAFLEDPGTDEGRVARRDELVQCNIYPIWYPQNEHDASIEAFLTKLKDCSE
ncbi:MAG: SIR2 family protein, partial [Pseudomonadales bacterium]